MKVRFIVHGLVYYTLILNSDIYDMSLVGEEQSRLFISQDYCLLPLGLWIHSIILILHEFLMVLISFSPNNHMRNFKVRGFEQLPNDLKLIDLKVQHAPLKT